MGRKSSIKKVIRNNSQSKDIQAAIMMDLYLKGYSPIVANYTGQGMSECDVLAVSKADLIYEFEIKISRADFKKDFNKKHKHELLEKRQGTRETWNVRNGERVNVRTWFQTPSYFSYLCPRDMIRLDEVPEYAGLVYVSEDYQSFEWMKKAPKLHDHRADATLIRNISHNLTCKQIFGSSLMTYLKKKNEEDMEGYISERTNKSDDEAP